jgi:hypothetical protein
VRVLFDTNVLIDAAVSSRQYHDVSFELFDRCVQGQIDGILAPVSVATCWYVATNTYDVDPRPMYEYLKPNLTLARMGWPAVEQALETDREAHFGDVTFEDQFLSIAGMHAGAKVVATRNEQDFQGGALSPHHPADLISMFRS